MKFEDKRIVRNININVGDLIIGENSNYIVTEDMNCGINEYKFHVIDVSDFKIIDSTYKLNNAYESIKENDDILEVIPKESLKIVAV